MIDHWHNCYDNGWKGLITDAAFAHPAKFAHGLIKRIYTHLLAEGMVQPGAVVLDPFGGVALGGLYAMQNGLHWVGCELEPKFVELGQANIDLWNARYAAHFPRWGSAQLLQGDSRRLAEIVSGAGCVVGSPPYADSFTKSSDDASGSGGRKNGQGGSHGGAIPAREYGQTPGQLAALPPGSVDAVIGSPPYAETRMDGGRIAKEGQGGLTPYSGEDVDAWRTTRDQKNLGNLPPGDISALISSPPFAGNTGGRGEASRNGIDPGLFDRHSGGMKRGTGSDPANLDNLRMGAVVGSPPYAETPVALKDGATERQMRSLARAVAEGRVTGRESVRVAQKGFNTNTNLNSTGGNYGQTPGQLGAESSETFWTAAKTILDQCALLLPPGAPAVWVVKDYVKGGKIVPFAAQWQALCEACGFETVHIHRAWLVKRNGTQETMANGYDTSASMTNLLGEDVAKEGAALANKSLDVERYSFFRRLHIKKNPHLAVEWETVLCTVRREAA